MLLQILDAKIRTKIVSSQTGLLSLAELRQDRTSRVAHLGFTSYRLSVKSPSQPRSFRKKLGSRSTTRLYFFLLRLNG